MEKAIVEDTPEFAFFYPHAIEDVLATEHVLVEGRLDNPYLKLHGVPRTAL